jgi:hypothetical protein
LHQVVGTGKRLLIEISAAAFHKEYTVFSPPQGRIVRDIADSVLPADSGTVFSLPNA